MKPGLVNTNWGQGWSIEIAGSQGQCLGQGNTDARFRTVTSENTIISGIYKEVLGPFTSVEKSRK